MKNVLRKHSYSDATFYGWRSRLGGLDASEVRRLREIEPENTKRKKLLAEARRAKTGISKRRSFALIGLSRAVLHYEQRTCSPRETLRGRQISRFPDRRPP